MGSGTAPATLHVHVGVHACVCVRAYTQGVFQGPLQLDLSYRRNQRKGYCWPQ